MADYGDRIRKYRNKRVSKRQERMLEMAGQAEQKE